MLPQANKDKAERNKRKAAAQKKQPEKIVIKMGSGRRPSYNFPVTRSMRTEAVTLATVEVIAKQHNKKANDLVNEALEMLIKKYGAEPVTIERAKEILEGGA